MECREVQQLLDAFAADELEPAQRQSIEKHLAECPVCRKEAQALRRTISLLGQFKEMDPPAVFLLELRQRLEKRQPRGILDRLLPRPVFARVLAAVSCLLVAGLGVWIVIRQLLPSTEVEERYAGDKLEGDRIALLDKEGKAANEFAGAHGVSKARAEETAESTNGDISAGEIHSNHGAAGVDMGRYAITSGRPVAAPSDAASGGRAIGTPLAPRERPAEPTPFPAATAAAREPRAAGYMDRPGDTEPPAGEQYARGPGGTMSKAAASELAGDSRSRDNYGRAKDGHSTTTDSGQMARGGAAGMEEKSQERKEEIALAAEKEKAGAFRARTSHEAEEVAKDEARRGSPRQLAPQMRKDETPMLEEALQVQPARDANSDTDYIGEDLSVAADAMNGSKAGLDDMTGLAVLGQERSAPEPWHFFGLGNLVKGYDRLDSPTPELVMVVQNIPQARAEIQKAVAEVGGSAEVAMETESTTKPADEGEIESFQAERSFSLSDSSTGFLLRDGRTDLLVVRLKAGTYEAFRRKLLPRRAGVVSGPQPSRGTQAIPAEEEARKEEGEMTLLVRLVEIGQQPSQETQSPQTQQPAP